MFLARVGNLQVIGFAVYRGMVWNVMIYIKVS